MSVFDKFKTAANFMEVSSHISLKKAAKGSFGGGKTHEI